MNRRAFLAALAILAAFCACAERHQDSIGVGVWPNVGTYLEPGSFVYVDREAMLVAADGHLIRGQCGTKRSEHAAGTVVYFATLAESEKLRKAGCHESP